MSEAQFFRIGNDLEVFLGTGQGVRVTNHFGAYIGGPQPVEFLVFADQQVSSSQSNAWANPKVSEPMLAGSPPPRSNWCRKA